MAESTRDRWISAAERVFARRGLHAATVAEIATDAGLSVGLLYRYFPGKTELAVAIVERDREQTVATIDEVASVTGSRAALEVLIDGWLDEALEHRALSALVADISAEAGREGALAVAALRHERDVVDAVAGIVARAAAPTVDATAVAVLLVSALDGLTMRLAIDHGFDPRPSVEALRRGLPALLGA
jgi:AcrR family transcriptional regulator